MYQTNGRPIELFLVDGKPDGMLTAQILSMDGAYFNG